QNHSPGTRASSGSPGSAARRPAYRYSQRYRTLFLGSFHLLSFLLGPPGPHSFLSFVKSQGSGRDIVTEGGCRGHVHIITQRNRRDQSGVASDLHAVPDFRTIFMNPVVVTNNGSRPNVGVPSNRHISQIGKMIRLGIFTEGRFFRLNEVADVNVGAQRTSRSKMGKRSDNRAHRNTGACHDHRELNMNFIANLSIRQIGAAVNLTAFADDSVSTEMRVWADNGILANHNVIVDIRRAWVFERNAIVHPLSIDSFLQRLLHLRELLSGIDAHHFTGVVHL